MYIVSADIRAQRSSIWRSLSEPQTDVYPFRRFMYMESNTTSLRELPGTHETIRGYGESLSYELAHDQHLFGGQLVNVRSKFVGISCCAVLEKRDDMLLHVVSLTVISPDS